MKSSLVITLLCIALSPLLAQSKQSVQVNGVSIYYETYGKGSPLVLLHGFTQNHCIWYNLIDSLSSDYMLIIPDMRGHGKSTNPNGKFTHHDSALDIYALLDKLGIDKLDAIGYSSGGITLLHMATQQPDRISNLVLISTSSYYSNSARQILRSFTYENLNAQQLSYFRSIHERGDEQIKQILSQLNNFADTYNDLNFTTPYLSTIKSRTLIILGDSDPLFSIEEALNMHRSIPNSSLWIVPNQDHNLITTTTLWQTSSLSFIRHFLMNKGSNNLTP
jgi:pimeloyl-ACP methyl ester carboxylesterase